MASPPHNMINSKELNFKPYQLSWIELKPCKYYQAGFAITRGGARGQSPGCAEFTGSFQNKVLLYCILNQQI